MPSALRNTLSAFVTIYDYGRAAGAEPPRPVVQKLSMLTGPPGGAARQRLINVYNQLAGPLAEQQGFIDPVLQKQLSKSCQASLIALQKDRKAVEKAIDALIESDSRLSQLRPGGPV